MSFDILPSWASGGIQPFCIPMCDSTPVKCQQEGSSQRDAMVPAAFLDENRRWDAIDDSSAKVTITNGNRRASGVMYFAGEGLVTSFVCDRYHEANGEHAEDTWETPMAGYGEFCGTK